MTTGTFTVGGAVQASGGVYIERKADRDLIELCCAGTFAYILAPRQIGKSSLMLHTVRRLKQRGVACVTIILTSRDVTADQWYRSLLLRIADQLHLRTDPQRWWAQHDDLSFSQRFKLFLQEVLPAETTQRVVIFVDEIELTLGLAFADDFFGALRSLYDERASLPALERISFVLIGAASPGELIKQPSRAPFNVGRAVMMTDFTFEEAQQLAQGFSVPLEDSKRVLGHILDWTGGHPYLTQYLCSALLDHTESWDRAGIARLVRHTLFGASETYNSNLQEVQRTLTKRSEDPYATLTTYRTILRRGHVPNSAQSPAQAALKLSGIVESRNDRLEVRNQIYRQVFDESWVQEQLVCLPNYLPRRILHTLQYAAYILLLPLFLLAVFAGYQWYRANRESQAAQHAVATAVTANQQAQVARVAAAAAAELEKSQRQSAEAAALALLAQARQGDGDFSLRTLLSAAQRGWVPIVDQTMRQIMRSQQCVELNRPVYDAVWPAGGTPHALIGASAGLPALAIPNLVLHQIEPAVARSAWLSQDGGKMIVPYGADTARILDADTQEISAELRGTGGILRRAVWSPNGRHLLTIADSGIARVWDTASGGQVPTLADEMPALAAAWSSDGQRIVIAGTDGALRAWPSGAKLSPIEPGVPGSAIDQVAWRSDDTQIAVGNAAGAVQVWDVTSSTLLFTLDAQPSPIRAISWSRRLRYIMTISDDNKTRLWDAKTGTRLSVLEIELPLVAAWSADDRQIMIAGEAGAICVYDTPEGLMASTRELQIEPLPPGQVAQLLQELLPTPLPPTGIPTPAPTATVDAATTPEPPTITPSSFDPIHVPSESYVVPEDTATAPVETTVVPASTTASPTAVPATTTASPTAIPATTTASAVTATTEATADSGTPSAEPTATPVEPNTAPTAGEPAPSVAEPTSGNSSP
jgi:hypothetical protein